LSGYYHGTSKEDYQREIAIAKEAGYQQKLKTLALASKIIQEFEYSRVKRPKDVSKALKRARKLFDKFNSTLSIASATLKGTSEDDYLAEATKAKEKGKHERLVALLLTRDIIQLFDFEHLRDLGNISTALLLAEGKIWINDRTNKNISSFFER